MSGGQQTCFVSGISSATATSSVLGSSSATATISVDWPEGERERKEREGKREEWEAMDSGIAFLGWGGSKDQDFCWGSIDCPIYWP